MENTMLRYFLFLFVLLLFVSCSSEKFITSQWVAPAGTHLIITTYYKGVLFDDKLPAIIDLGNQPAGQGTDYNKYFLQLFTPSNQSIYGTLIVSGSTALTELSNVKIEITQSLIDKVLDNQVSQITVTDPVERVNIVLINFGNKMPKEMKKVYERFKLN